MITMAKTLELQGREILALKGGPPVVPMAPVAAVPGIQQHIEHESPATREIFTMDVQFHGSDAIEYAERQKMAEDFLHDFKELCRDYKIKTMSGTYAKPTL